MPLRTRVVVHVDQTRKRLPARSAQERPATIRIPRLHQLIHGDKVRTLSNSERVVHESIATAFRPRRDATNLQSLRRHGPNERENSPFKALEIATKSKQTTAAIRDRATQSPPVTAQLISLVGQPPLSYQSIHLSATVPLTQRDSLVIDFKHTDAFQIPRTKAKGYERIRQKSSNTSIELRTTIRTRIRSSPNGNHNT